MNKLKYCAYCGEKILTKPEQDLTKLKCTYCDAKLYDTKNRVLKIYDGNSRFKFNNLQKTVSLDDAKGSVEILKSYNIFDLYLLLKEVREARSGHYTTFNIFKEASKCSKATKEDAKQFYKLSQTERQAYVYWTRRQCIIENILIEKQGFFPEAITQELLHEKYEQILKSKNRRMVLSN
ncbi:hypothetical protein NKS28_27590 [Bacillus sp. 1663tsa1]|nr:hypothetical protein [Bacillus sp. 1663tsa1]MCP1181177.1 hypothetical protein [Bacillus sp. 1663tsa1]